MVKVGLNLSCSVDHIDELQTGPNYCWNLKFECKSCNESDGIWHSVSEEEEVKGKAGPGTFNFQMKCKFCFNVFTIDVLKDTVKVLKSRDGDRINNQTIVVFECRGAEPIDFDPQDGWLGKCEETGSKFDDIDFTQDTCWAGYDDKGKFPVSIDDLTWKFSRV